MKEKNRECRKCRKITLQTSILTVERGSGVMTDELTKHVWTYTCIDCGYVETVERMLP